MKEEQAVADAEPVLKRRKTAREVAEAQAAMALISATARLPSQATHTVFRGYDTVYVWVLGLECTGGPAWFLPQKLGRGCRTMKPHTLVGFTCRLSRVMRQLAVQYGKRFLLRHV